MDGLSASSSGTAWHELPGIAFTVAAKLPTNAEIYNVERVSKLWRDTHVPLPEKVQMHRLGLRQLAWLKRNAHRIAYYTLAMGESVQTTRDFENMLDQSLLTFCAPHCVLRQLTIVQREALHNTPRHWALPDCLGRLTGLQKLQLSCCSMSQVPSDILTAICGLRELELKSSYLESLPNIKQLSQLHRLVIQDCAKLVNIDSVGEVTGLETFTLASCSELKCMPSLENLGRTLHRLEVIDCLNLDTWTDHVQKLQKLEMLVLRKTTVQLPAQLYQMTALTRLDLGDTDGAEPFWADAMRFPHLASLTIRGYGMPALPQKLENVTKLTELLLDNCSVDEPMVWGLAPVRRLQRLLFIKAEHLSCLSEQMPESLTYLSIAGSSDLQLSSVVFQGLSKLEHLSLEGCESSTFCIPESIGNCRALTRLHIKDCPLLQMLPMSIRGLSSLVDLTISKCQNLCCLPPGFGPGNSSLRRLVLHDARCRRLPDGLAAAAALQELELIGLRKLECLPDLSNLFCLTSLVIKKCYMLHQWPDGLAFLLFRQQLQQLELSGTRFLDQTPPPEIIMGPLRHFRVQFRKPTQQQQPIPSASQSMSTPQKTSTASPFKTSCKSPYGDAKPVDCSPEMYFAKKLQLAEAATSSPPPQAAAASDQWPQSAPGQLTGQGWPDSPFVPEEWDAVEDPGRC